jgi:antitoxin FitA
MPNLSIKDVPEHWAETLRQRAIRHHRSLQGELLAMVEAFVVGSPSGSGNHPAHPRTPNERGELMGRRRGGRKTVDEISLEIRAKFPETPLGAPLAVDIVRAERDAR